MSNPQCKWVRDRLPLLAGNDLLGSERRRVERHLIGCSHCRGRRDALGSAFGVLQLAAGESPLNGDAPSLWPALARQIREARRPAPRLGLSWLFDWSRLRPWPTFGLGMGLLAAFGLTFSVRYQASVSRAEIAKNARPVEALSAGPELTDEQPPQVYVAHQDEPAAEAASPPRFDYDLDRGTPMGPDSLETKSKLTH